MKRKLSSAARSIVKEQKGIVNSEKTNKRCSNCFFYSSRKLCSKHYLITSSKEVCKEFSPKQVKIYRGGSVSPR